MTCSRVTRRSRGPWGAPDHGRRHERPRVARGREPGPRRAERPASVARYGGDPLRGPALCRGTHPRKGGRHVLHRPGSTAVRRGRAQWAFLTGRDGPWVRIVVMWRGRAGAGWCGWGSWDGPGRGVSKSVAKAPRDRIGREKNCGISTILFRRSRPIGAFATDLDNRPSGRLNEHPELRPRCGAWDSWDVRGAPARRGSGGRCPRPPTTAPGPRRGASRPRCRDDPPDPRAGLGAAVRLKRDRPRPRRPRRPQRSVSARSPMRPRRPLR